MRSAVAGTFAVLHRGHRDLLDRVFALGDSVFVGITSDEMALGSREDTVPLYLRLKELEEYLAGYSKPYEIAVIDDVLGPRDRMDEVDVLVVSEESADGGLKVSEDREKRGLGPLRIDVVPVRTAADGSKISSTGILKGLYSREGNTDVPTVSVGSANHIKVEAVRRVFERIFGEARVSGSDVGSGVPDQPRGPETREGAVNRAHRAIGDRDFGVGIEAGVFELEDGLYDYQYCAVLDREGRITIGTGPGFLYPPAVSSYVRGGLTVGDAMKKVFGETDIGKRQGAIGYLSNGLLDRETLTEQAVVAAMVPRLNPSYLERSHVVAGVRRFPIRSGDECGIILFRQDETHRRQGRRFGCRWGGRAPHTLIVPRIRCR